ncbi:MAG: extensin family protein [Bradyrhizobium sp.]|uniref:extensin-like domain-containing protein n=1 Tax=Bradyrhizobium sp. TaxID=376 RepID=UPI0025B8A3EC|nr:extensin family protein [Bradyrhizobium sp.]MBI5265511.1 extensin family protein [Bradyrhizobium sp.]
MTRGVRLYLVGSLVLVSLAGCGRGFFFQEREPWRAEAEIACLKSGSVKESADIVRVEPISGPGVCGAEYPLKVAALGENTGTFGFADEDLRPPASIGNQPRWPVSQPRYPQGSNYPPTSNHPANSSHPQSAGAPSGPISLTPPGVAPQQDEIEVPPEGTGPGRTTYMNAPSYPARAPYSTSYPQGPRQRPLPRLGPAQGNPVAAVGPVAIKPTATLACPIVSALDRWLAESVQPAAMRWFGSPVVEIKQISAYSCRGMNGNRSSHISEHAFGNALDIAAFTLADGRRITIKDGWRGVPEEQGFLRDIEAAACDRFTTVLAPGSNIYHYDHIHVDLMRRASRRVICQPAPVSGDEVAARASQRNPYASRDPYVTGSLAGKHTTRRSSREKINEEDEFMDE